MEDKDLIISKLKEKIQAQDKDIYHAATYGKQLLDDKEKLTVKFDDLLFQKELLEQEKHSLQLDLEAKVQVLLSQTNELDYQRCRADDFQEKLKTSDKENGILRKKIENVRKENQYLKKAQEDLSIENKSLKDKVNLLEKQIKNFEDQVEKSLCESFRNETQELQAQLNTYMLNNKELQEGLSDLQCELEKAKKNENHLLQMVRELEDSLSERSAELSACNAEVKAAKEEIEDLHAEIEVLKFDQVDVKRRGNSVFAELDDRRHLVEREYKVLRQKYENFQKNYEENKKELDRARASMLMFQNMASRDYQQTYIDQLEDSLSSAKMEIRELTLKLSKVVKSNAKLETEVKGPEQNSYDYLRVMLKQSQEKNKDLQNEVFNLRNKNMFDNDKLTQTQCRLYKAKEDIDSAKQEIRVLKQKVKELEQGILLNQPVEPAIRKPKVEILEGFKPPVASEKDEKVLNLNASLFPDPDTIPGELELGEDGFKQVKPPRKSNRFILREFNKTEPEDDVIEGSVKCSERKIETDTDDTEKASFAEVKGRKTERETNHFKISSKRKNDNCAQQ